jgi:hypothetical protein
MELLPKTDDPVSVRFSSIKAYCFCLGSLCILAPWAVVACYFFRQVDGSVPDFVYAAFLATFLLYVCFGLNALLHNVLGLYDFPTAEMVYIALSFTAKTFLAADVYGGFAAS